MSRIVSPWGRFYLSRAIARKQLARTPSCGEYRDSSRIAAFHFDNELNGAKRLNGWDVSNGPR
jgi:hypothetical protein